MKQHLVISSLGDGKVKLYSLNSHKMRIKNDIIGSEGDYGVGSVTFSPDNRRQLVTTSGFGWQLFRLIPDRFQRSFFFPFRELTTSVYTIPVTVPRRPFPELTPLKLSVDCGKFDFAKLLFEEGGAKHYFKGFSERSKIKIYDRCSIFHQFELSKEIIKADEIFFINKIKTLLASSIHNHDNVLLKFLIDDFECRHEDVKKGFYTAINLGCLEALGIVFPKLDDDMYKRDSFGILKKSIQSKNIQVVEFIPGKGIIAQLCDAERNKLESRTNSFLLVSPKIRACIRSGLEELEQNAERAKFHSDVDERVDRYGQDRPSISGHHNVKTAFDGMPPDHEVIVVNEDDDNGN